MRAAILALNEFRTVRVSSPVKVSGAFRYACWMDSIVVTGGAGFIGSNFVRLALARHSPRASSCVDKLTYAGNLESLADVADDPRYAFVRGRHRRPRRGARRLPRHRPDAS